MALRVWTDAEATCGRSTTWSISISACGTCGSSGVDVEAGGEDRAGLQRLDQRLLVHHAAARDVDQDAVRSERPEHLASIECFVPGPPGVITMRTSQASARPSSVGWYG